MMAGADDTGKGAAGDNVAPAKSTRHAKPALERAKNIIGTSNIPPAATPLQAAMDVLSTAITPNADAAATHAELEAYRKALLTGAADVAHAQRDLDITLHEYNAAHGFAFVSADPARVAVTRLRGRNLDKDFPRSSIQKICVGIASSTGKA
jgi:hypothetical protein